MLWADRVCSLPMTIRRLATGAFKRAPDMGSWWEGDWHKHDRVLCERGKA